MYKFYIEEWFHDQAEFEDWIAFECNPPGVKYELFFIQLFGYIPVIKKENRKEKDFRAYQVIFKKISPS